MAEMGVFLSRKHSGRSDGCRRVGRAGGGSYPGWRCGWLKGLRQRWRWRGRDNQYPIVRFCLLYFEDLAIYPSHLLVLFRFL